MPGGPTKFGLKGTNRVFQKGPASLEAQYAPRGVRCVQVGVTLLQGSLKLVYENAPAPETNVVEHARLEDSKWAKP